MAVRNGTDKGLLVGRVKRDRGRWHGEAGRLDRGRKGWYPVWVTCPRFYSFQ